MADIFRSARLTYRAIEDTPEDDALLSTIAADLEGYVNSTLGLLKPPSKKGIMDWKTHLTSKTLLSVVICLAPSEAEPGSTQQPAGEPIGVIALQSTDYTHYRNADISVDIVSTHQRQGYGSEAIRWIVRWGFRVAGLHRVAVESFSYNKEAGRLYERLGFVFEGRKRDYIWYDGGWHDLLSFSMLEDDWKKFESEMGNREKGK